MRSPSENALLRHARALRASCKTTIQRLNTRLRPWLLRETYALPLDLFRILAGLLCVGYFLTLLWQARDFSNPDGFLDHVVLRRIFWFTGISLFHPGLGLAFFHVLFGLAGVVSWGIVLGYRIKLCVAILYAIAVSTYRWNFIVMYVDDVVMHLVLFWLLLLPVGRTLTLGDYLGQPRGCWTRWSRVTVPGAVVRCFLANVALLYLLAGLWKLTSPLWQQGFALYAILRLPLAYQPDVWGPQHLPLLRVLNYTVLIVELLLPIFLVLRRGHPLKWVGLVCQLGFHLGILLTLRIPFANLGLMATAPLFFRQEIVHWLQRDRATTMVLGQAPHFDRPARFALVFLVVLTLAVLRGVPVLGGLNEPAYALLWGVGIAQDYRLFNWIDRVNYRTSYRVTLRAANGTSEVLSPELLLPPSPRGTVLQAYLYNVRWMLVPRKHRRVLKQSLIARIAQRWCSRHPVEGTVTVKSTRKRIRPTNADLKHGWTRLLMQFQCAEGTAVLCRTMLAPRAESACHFEPTAK